MTQLFVPGRLCLFGEHSDWAGRYRVMNAEIEPGLAIVTGIEQGIEATIERSTIFEVHNTSPELKDLWHDFSCPMEEQALKQVARSGNFFSYCAGVASYMQEWYRVGGVSITITRMTLPVKSGLSSSAAICVLVARAFNQVYNLNLNTMGEMNIAYLGEQRTKSRCGRLDQACAFGVKPSLMSFDGDEIEVKPLNVKHALHWVFADLCAKKDTIRILSDLNKAYPFASTEQEKQLQHALGKVNRQLVERAAKYIAEGNEEELGALMTESERIFNEQIAPMSPALKAPKLQQVLNDPEIQALTYGGKGVGSHGDGSVQFLARGKEQQQALFQLLIDRGLRPYTLTLKPIHAVRRAIIPVAGFGTRLWPSTRTLKKDFFPIPCADGMVRPVILILLEELVKSGIEEICLVLGGEEERELYANFFERPLSPEHHGKLSHERQEIDKKILNIGRRLTYVYQNEKRGFGHAVYQANEFTQGEPVLLMLGDTLYRSATNKTCSLQLIEDFELYNLPMVGLVPVPLHQVSHFGMVSGVWEDKQSRLMRVKTIKEKPTANYSEEFLGVKDHNEQTEYLSVSGQYILTNDVFMQLEEDIRHADEAGDKTREIELTSAIESVRQKKGLMGSRLRGERFDMGNPAALVDTVVRFGK
jgi:UTP-glucose-1-phosphate uridylyltransferase/galactokinase